MYATVSSFLTSFYESFAVLYPLLIGEGIELPVEIYNQYLGENGTDHNFAAAISVIAILITAIVFFLQKFAVSKYKFSINALHPIQKKKPTGIKGVFIYFYCYALVLISFIPQLYIIYLSFRNCDQAVFKPGFSLNNYQEAMNKLLIRSITNTGVIGLVTFAIIILFSVLMLI